MAYNEELALRIRQSLGEQTGIVERKMFGGLCFMAHGNMCCGVMGDEIIVRVGAERYEDSLQMPHARPMGFTGRPMRGFVVVASKGIESEEGLDEWIARGVKFAMSLPPSRITPPTWTPQTISLICCPHLSIIVRTNLH